MTFYLFPTASRQELDDWVLGLEIALGPSESGDSSAYFLVLWRGRGDLGPME